MASTLGAASYLTALLGRLGVPDGRPTIAVLAVVVGALALALMIRGVRLSARIIVDRRGVRDRRGRGGADRDAFTGTGRRDRRRRVSYRCHRWTIRPSGFALLLAITSYVGFESASTVAREAQRPFVTVTRAIRWTPLALGVLYVFAAAMQSRGTGRHHRRVARRSC